jgi:hippurate hydrolase
LDEHTPAAYNDPALTAAAAIVFKQTFGPENLIDLKPEMVGEDFGVFARHLGVPGIQFRVGSVSRAAYEASLRPNGPVLPPLHSDGYTPEPEPTLRTGIRAMTNLALALFDER